MHSEGFFCLRRVAQLRASQESQAVPPCCPPLTPVWRPPAIHEQHAAAVAPLPSQLAAPRESECFFADRSSQ